MAKDTLYNNSAQDEMQAIYDLLREDRILRYRERQGGEAINSQQQDKNAKMAAIIARMAKPPESFLARDLTMHQNYVDSLQMEKEKRMAEEREARERSRLREGETKNNKNKSLGLQPFRDAWKRLTNPNPLEVPKDHCDKQTSSPVQDHKDYWECKTRKDWH